MRILNYLNGIQGVAPGGVATVTVPVRRRYHAFKIFVSATIAAAPNFDPTAIIASVRVLVNGKLMRDLLPADIINIAKLNGITPNTADGELPIYLSEPWRASVLGEELLSWDLALEQTCTIEISFILAGVTNIACAVEASFDFGRNLQNAGTPAEAPLFNIVKQLRYGQSAPAGQSNINNLPTNLPIQRVHFRISAGTISAIEVDNNSQKILEGLTAQLSDFYKDYKLDTSHFAISAIFDYSQQVSDAMFPQNNNVNYIVTCSDGGNLTAIVEQRANGYV